MCATSFFENSFVRLSALCIKNSFILCIQAVVKIIFKFFVKPLRIQFKTIHTHLYRYYIPYTYIKWRFDKWLASSPDGTIVSRERSRKLYYRSIRTTLFEIWKIRRLSEKRQTGHSALLCRINGSILIGSYFRVFQGQIGLKTWKVTRQTF